MASPTPGPGAPADDDPLRHHAHLEHPVMGDSFMERVSEKVASGMGTVGFLVVSLAIILGWVLLNHVGAFLRASYHGLLDGKGFDPAPFILLNLVFSAVAFFTGALVIIASKAQAKRDRANSEADARHREELAQTNLRLLRQNTELTTQIAALTRQVHEHILKERPPTAPAA